MHNYFYIFQNETSERIDKFLAHETNLSRSVIQKIIKEENCSVNGKICNNQKYHLNNGDEISFKHEIEKNDLAEKIEIDIIFEDDEIIIVNKKVGMVVHPSGGTKNGTLVNALLGNNKKLSSIGADENRPGIIHRLDKDTSGLLLVAKNDAAHLYFKKAIKERRVKRIYHAFIIGEIYPRKGIIDNFIGPDPKTRMKKKIYYEQDERNKRAITEYETKKLFGCDMKTGHALASLVECSLLTGRTHQIRAHFAENNHIIGDKIYGRNYVTGLPKIQNNKINVPDEIKEYITQFPCQALIAKKLAFTHINGKDMEFEIDYPKELQMLYECFCSLNEETQA